MGGSGATSHQSQAQKVPCDTTQTPSPLSTCLPFLRCGQRGQVSKGSGRSLVHRTAIRLASWRKGRSCNHTGAPSSPHWGVHRTLSFRTLRPKHAFALSPISHLCEYSLKAHRGQLPGTRGPALSHRQQGKEPLPLPSNSQSSIQPQGPLPGPLAVPWADNACQPSWANHHPAGQARLGREGERERPSCKAGRASFSKPMTSLQSTAVCDCI